jgi:6-pyruvoyltetrahydropterin/6-carboxytetrahydropterin synthase
MRCQLVRDYAFEAAHFLPNVPEAHKCRRMHGHSYHLSVVIEGELDDRLGWVMDFGDLDERVMPLVRRLDHYVLNEIEGLENPTSEILAVWLWRALKPQLSMLVELQISETASSRCVYRGE